MSVTIEVVVMWAAVTLYAVSAIVNTVATVFRLHRLQSFVVSIGALGAATQLVALIGRWIRLGHGPYLGFYEVVSSYALIAVIFWLILAWRFRGLRVLGVVVMPLAFLALAGSMLAPKAGFEITPTLASWWLAVHVTFAKLSYGAFVGAFFVSILFLLRAPIERRLAPDIAEKIPSQNVLDDLSFRLVAIGFVFLGVMIAAGAIWANEAWGRYWGWDPIETWSLIAWLVYAAVLHARLMMGVRGRKFAWLAAAALPVVLFALVGVPVVYHSIHGAYLLGTD